MLPIEYEPGMPVGEGLYIGIPLSEYHGNVNLLPGPSVSKSALKNIAPPDGCPKKFWQHWPQNPNHIKSKRSDALDFGKAAHALLLGDEVFKDHFVVMPETVDGEPYHGSKTVWKRWFRLQEELGLTVISQEDLEQIQRMAEDAHQHPLVANGGLNGLVEVSMFWRDPETGIWLRSRPDVSPNDGIYIDFKTTGQMTSGYLSRQIADAGYYLQGAMTRMVCNGLGIPFKAFGFLYSLSKDYADTDFRVLSEEDLVLGEAVIRWGLRQIRHGLSTGEWPGMAIYAREDIPIRMPEFVRSRISDFLTKEGFL